MVDGLFIRSLLMAFFFKLFPEIIQDGRLYIAEPPLYRIADKNNPFVINKEDYVNRYVKAVMKDYKVEIIFPGDKEPQVLSKEDIMNFLTKTSSYVEDMDLLSEHYKINDRLLEIIFEELSMNGFDPSKRSLSEEISRINIQSLMNHIGAEFPEIYFDDKDKLIKGVIDGRYQLLEISEQLLRKATEIITLISEWKPGDSKLILKDMKTGTENTLSVLGLLKILKKYQPDILHRFKGLMARPF